MGASLLIRGTPVRLNDLCRIYVGSIERAFGSRGVGAYLHGSVALGAFHARTSDIDFVTVLEGPISSRDRGVLDEIHRRLRREAPLADRLDGIYVEPEQLSRAMVRHTAVRRGRLLRSGERLGVVARLILRERGMVLAGPSPRDIFPEVTRAELDGEMDFNLNVYWRRRAARPLRFLFDEMVDFTVTTLPRILHTLADGTVITKPEAIDELAREFPQWGHLAREVRRRMEPARSGHAFSTPVSQAAPAVPDQSSPLAVVSTARRWQLPSPARIARAAEIRRFVLAMIDEGNERYIVRNAPERRLT